MGAHAALRHAWTNDTLGSKNPWELVQAVLPVELVWSSFNGYVLDTNCECLAMRHTRMPDVAKTKDQGCWKMVIAPKMRVACRYYRLWSLFPQASTCLCRHSLLRHARVPNTPGMLNIEVDDLLLWCLRDVIVTSNG